MREIIQEIKKDNYSNFIKLLEMFNPLINSWLYKIKPPKNEREDYYSSAKIILLESIKTYDEAKRVPFPSYYKIKLYNWYGNQITKSKSKPNTCQLYDEDKSEEVNYIEHLELGEKVAEIKKYRMLLTEQERKILDMLLKNISENTIAQELGLSKKTILNKKYIIISKLKNILKDKLEPN